MDFEQKKKIKNNEINYHLENLKITREFSKDLILEMKELVKSIVLFGSNTNDTLNKDSDIDLMIILDNISVFVSKELQEAYHIITQKIASKHPNKLHIMTVNLSDFWDMARKGDPVFINILRYGLPIFDRDLVEPMQYLLEIGKIKPTREAANNYIARSQTLMEETTKHLQNSILDMYYSVIDIVHATLMTQKITPPSPKEMPKIFKSTFKGNSLERYSIIIDEFYKIAKQIEHGKANFINGKIYDELHKKAVVLVNDLTKFSQNEIKKSDIFDI